MAFVAINSPGWNEEAVDVLACSAHVLQTNEYGAGVVSGISTLMHTGYDGRVWRIVALTHLGLHLLPEQA